ncbi:beta-lactamase [Skermanella stibiiresistens SB22]|uniref:Beta-lactamase n=1 Tax=Skermanella stibiiresistens SB22 TaxID=1385369 RepID=W9GWJ4_9PROT|nr:class A beta-lactamase [Skermanella stibiiresistens]EWY38270.1 beta-lactamase [Skermanella stibiiresistens SB22]
MLLTRRHFSLGLGTLLAGATLVRQPLAAAAETGPAADLARIETGISGRLGVAVHDTGTGRRLEYRSGQRFPMCSTFKVVASAALLTRVDAGREKLDRRIRFGAGDLVTYSPVTKDRVGGDGMTLAELCEAGITQSDNTAANLLLANIGGPAGMTEYARSLGDAMTRLDRIETELNESTPGDPRDTTTPAAMTETLRKLVLGDALSPASRDHLAAWLVANKTGDARLRAGVPKDWRVGDKTGSGDHGTANDIGVFWPPGRAPLVVSVYLTETKASMDDRSAAIAAVARVVTGWAKA